MLCICVIIVDVISNVINECGETEGLEMDF